MTLDQRLEAAEKYIAAHPDSLVALWRYKELMEVGEARTLLAALLQIAAELNERR